MRSRLYNALIASVAFCPVLLAADETFAGSGAVAVRGPGVNPPRSISHSAITRSIRHHGRNHRSAVGGYFYGPINGDAVQDFSQPASGNTHYTYTYDLPWDWVHKFPPSVVPAERPYVPSCSTETLSVGKRDGSEQTVNVTRCY